MPTSQMDGYFENLYYRFLEEPMLDDDMEVNHSDATWWCAKWPYKTTFLPTKGMKKKVWSAWFFRFVYFIRHRHVTGVKNQSNCIIPKMCGPPEFPSLLLFAHLDQKTVVQSVFRQFWKPDGPHFFFMPLFGRNVALYGHICTSSCDVRLSPPTYHHLVFYTLYSEYNN